MKFFKSDSTTKVFQNQVLICSDRFGIWNYLLWMLSIFSNLVAEVDEILTFISKLAAEILSFTVATALKFYDGIFIKLGC